MCIRDSSETIQKQGRHLLRVGHQRIVPAAQAPVVKLCPFPHGEGPDELLLSQTGAELDVYKRQVDALDHQYVAVSQRQLFTVVFPDALFEVEGGHIHRFALQQLSLIHILRR